MRTWALVVEARVQVGGDFPKHWFGGNRSLGNEKPLDGGSVDLMIPSGKLT